MKNVLYFILAIASLVFLAGIGYVGLQVVIPDLPEIAILSQMVEPYIALSGGLSIWTALPLLIPACLAFFNFFGKNLKIIFFILTILVIALDVFVLFFPDTLISIFA